jgi:hypothetical protein
VFYCDRAAGFSNDIGYQDEGYFDALVAAADRAGDGRPPRDGWLLLAVGRDSTTHARWLSLRQVDPLIRELTQYRDVIQQRIQFEESKS